jgi:predicted dehydrogenase
VLVGLVGCGRWGRNILRDLLSLGIDVIVADPAPDSCGLARRAGAQATVAMAEDLPKCDGIVVATPTSTHYAVIRNLLCRGVPIFAEKPLTCCPAEAMELAAAAPTSLFVMDKWRYHPGVEELRRIHESGEIGKTLGMRFRHVGWGLPHRDVDVTWILLPHCLSIILEVFSALPLPTFAAAERLRGKVVTLTTRLGRDPWFSAEVSSRTPVKARQFELHCEGGVAWLDDGWADHIKLARGCDGIGADANDIEIRPVSRELPLMRELRAFRDHLQGGPPPRSSAHEAARIVQTIHRVHDLLERG